MNPRPRSHRALAVLAACALSAGLAIAGAGAQGARQTPAQASITNATVERWMTDLSNWGRWGADDRLGALNLVTPQKRQKAFALVRDGVSVSLSRTYMRDPRNDATSPFMHQMLGVGAPGPFHSDRYAFSYHGAEQSHLDALCHMAHQGRMYNGVPRAEVTDAGCAKLGILDLRDGIATRAVLVDIPRLKGLDYLPPGTPITIEDLTAWEKMAGVRVEAGDLLLIRTGRWSVPPDKAVPRAGAGLHVSTMPWIRSRDIALMGSDYATDVVPSGIAEITLPNHQLLLVAMGVRIFDNLDLEALAAEAARRKRWEFLVTAAPLAVDGGTGSPINPIAHF